MHCNGCLSYQYPAMEVRQYIALGVCPTKVLWAGQGSALHWLFVLQTPCSAGQAVRCNGTKAMQCDPRNALQCVCAPLRPYCGDSDLTLGSRHCVALGVCPTNALLGGRGDE